jgi:diadenosine tetraphosphatase ApaH/serine/threonine PP2A family protein phosphatase
MHTISPSCLPSPLPELESTTVPSHDVVLSTFSPFWAPTSDLSSTDLSLPLLPSDVISSLITASSAHLQTLNPLLTLSGEFLIVGDLHGSISDLLRILKKFGRPPETHFLFLGDYVDRGPDSISVLILILSLMLKFPREVFLLRGNHEFTHVNQTYGFLDEVRTKYGSESLWQSFNELFGWLPIAAVIDHALFCVHGGLSPLLNDVEALSEMPLPIVAYEPDSVVADLMWSDPVDGFWGFQTSTRGSGKIFGHDRVEAFLKRNKLRLLVRAHQCNDTGCRMFANMMGITVFSASNYCQLSMNKCGVLEFRGANDVFAWTVDPAREQLPVHWQLAGDGGIGMRKRGRALSSANIAKDTAMPAVDVARSRSFAPWNRRSHS